MASTEQLLEMSTRGAVVRMLNDANATFFDGGNGSPLVISPPLSAGGLRTEVEISVRRQLSKADRLPFPGQLTFRYNRLDVAANLGQQLLGYRPPLPTSTKVLLNELTNRTGIRFEDDDFILEDIGRDRAAPYVLKAKPESLRWTGSLEVTLIDLTNLATYIPPGLPATAPQLLLTGPAISTGNNQPYLNATLYRGELANLVIGEAVASASHPLVSFVQKVVAEQGHFLRDSSNVWKAVAGNSAYNLMGAQVTVKDAGFDTINTLIPATTRAIKILLGAQETLYTNKELVIAYAETNFDGSEYNNQPRLKSSAVINASNGTPWNKWLNTLPAPSVITEIPSQIDLRINGPDRWVANATVPSPTNLYNAVVQYNGPRRVSDIAPYYTQCNRVLVVTVSDKNTAYQGNLVFHYRSPIVINDRPSNAVFGSPYDFNLAPSEGVAPYTMTLVAGQLAPNHIITSDYHIRGNTATTGLFNASVDVTDAAGTTVRFALSYRAVVGPIQVDGVPPQAVRGVPYNLTFTVSGGRPDYTYRLLPTGQDLNLPSPFVPKVEGTFTGAAGSRTFALEVTDTVGTVYTHSFTVMVT